MGSILFLNVNIAWVLIKIVTKYIKKLCKTLCFITIQFFVIYLLSDSVFPRVESMCICETAQPVFTCAKSKMETPEQYVKYVQS